MHTHWDNYTQQWREYGNEETEEPTMEYYLTVYDSMNDFNQNNDAMAEYSWMIQDFRFIPSPDPKIVNGVVVLWSRGRPRS